MGILVEHAHKVAYTCMHIAHCELVRRALDYGDGERKRRDDQFVCWRVVRTRHRYTRPPHLRAEEFIWRGNSLYRSFSAFEKYSGPIPKSHLGDTPFIMISCSPAPAALVYGELCPRGTLDSCV